MSVSLKTKIYIHILKAVEYLFLIIHIRYKPFYGTLPFHAHGRFFQAFMFQAQWRGKNRDHRTYVCNIFMGLIEEWGPLTSYLSYDPVLLMDKIG